MSYNPVIEATDRLKLQIRVLDATTTTEDASDFKESAVAARSSYHREDARQLLGVCYEVRSFVLQQAEELDGIPDEQHFITVSFYSCTAAGDSRGLALADVLGILSERLTETTGRSSVIFSYSRQYNFWPHIEVVRGRHGFPLTGRRLE